jgi:hypothetical protein
MADVNNEERNVAPEDPVASEEFNDEVRFLP